MKRTNIVKTLALATLVVGINVKSYAVQFYDTLDTKYENAAEILAELSIVKGVKDNIFDYNREVTRAEFAKMLVESSLKPSEIKALELDDSNIHFKDVSKSEWYYPYITVAVNNGFMEGFGDGTFKPNEGVTYAQISKLVTKALGHDYLTVSSSGKWYDNYLNKMYEYNLFKNVSFNDINDKAIRGNCAIVIWNMLTTNTWKMIYRNDQSGFTYVDSGSTLFNQKIIDHEYLLNVKVEDFKEINGELCVCLNGTYYKMFDQNSDINYSMIKGYSDVIFKRVEYPGKEVKLEVATINTDVGAKLYSGTYKELLEDGFSLNSKTRLSDDSDYAYIYHYENGEKDDRIVAVNTGNFVYVETIKIDDEGPEESGDTKKTETEKDKSHSEVTNQFGDDNINYRYSTEPKEFTRTINLNEDEYIIADGAVIFYDNKRIEWNEVKKDDILVEISKDKYYLLTKSTTLTTKLLDYSTKKGEYTITTSDLTYDTYENTTYTSYTSETKKKFNKLSEKDLSNLKNRRVRLTLDVTDRVIEIELLEDDISLGDFNVGFYEQFHFAEEFGEKNNSVTLIIDGKKKTYQTSITKSEFKKGEFVLLKFDEKNKKIVKSIEVISDGTKLSDKLLVNAIEMDELKNKLEYFDDEEVEILKVKYNYETGKYEKPISYEVSRMNIRDAKKLKGDSYECFGVSDSSDVYRVFIIKDDSGIKDTFYGLVKKIAQDKTYTKDEKTGEKKEELGDIHIFVQRVNTKTTEDLVLEGKNTCEVGDFIYYKNGESEKNIAIIEKYSTSILGYEKDYKITAINKKGSTSTIVSYEINGNIELDPENPIIKDGKLEYDFEDYEIFLLKVFKNDNEKWEIKSAEIVNMESFKFEEGDMLAFNEIEGTLIIYRGYTDLK